MEFVYLTLYSLLVFASISIFFVVVPSSQSQLPVSDSPSGNIGINSKVSPFVTLFNSPCLYVFPLYIISVFSDVGACCAVTFGLVQVNVVKPKWS